MPYLKQEDRDRLDSGGTPQNGGELNYEITKILAKYIEEHELKYSNINDVMGAIEGAKLEFYRRVAGPYEDTKVLTNGDVYPTWMTN